MAQAGRAAPDGLHGNHTLSDTLDPPAGATVQMSAVPPGMAEAGGLATNFWSQT